MKEASVLLFVLSLTFRALGKIYRREIFTKSGVIGMGHGKAHVYNFL